MHPNSTINLSHAESKYPYDNTGLIEGRFISLCDNDGDDNVETMMMMVMVLR